MRRREKGFSIGLSEKRCFLHLFLDERGFQDLTTDGDIHKVQEPRLYEDCSYSFQLVSLYSFLYFGLQFFCVVPSSYPSFEFRMEYNKFVYVPKPYGLS